LTILAILAHQRDNKPLEMHPDWRKCISTEIEASPGNAQRGIIQACGIHDPLLVPNRIGRRKLR